MRMRYLKFAPEDAIHKTHEKLALGFDQRKLTGVSLSSLRRMSGLQPCNTGRMSRWGMSAPKLVMAENASQLSGELGGGPLTVYIRSQHLITGSSLGVRHVRLS